MSIKYTRCRDLTLQKDGVQVVQNILNNEEIKELRNLMWQWLNLKTKHTSNPIVKKSKNRQPF